MGEVILIGDSIRMGYQPFVEKELEGTATVHGAQQNGGTSENVLNNLDEWVLSRGAALVHLNCGLHDLRTWPEEGKSVPLPEYRKNVEEILRTILDKASLKAVWALTTPVIEERHNPRRDFDRFEADVVAYNREAAEICNRLGVPVNDLYSVVMCAGPGELLGQDGVHFTPEGSALLGKAVADAIRANL